VQQNIMFYSSSERPLPSLFDVDVVVCMNEIKSLSDMLYVYVIWMICLSDIWMFVCRTWSWRQHRSSWTKWTSLASSPSHHSSHANHEQTETELRDEGLVWVWLIGAVVCLCDAPWVQLFASAGNGWSHNIISSCQSAATSEIVKHFWSRVWLM